MNDSVKYGLGSVALGVVSYFWETAGFGIFLAILGGLAAYTSYNEAESKKESTGLAITGGVISIIALIYNISFL
jgi:hypothetical protein